MKTTSKGGVAYYYFTSNNQGDLGHSSVDRPRLQAHRSCYTAIALKGLVLGLGPKGLFCYCLVKEGALVPKATRPSLVIRQ